MASVFPAFISARAVAGGPCDIYLAGRTPCVAAHSTVRALYSSYDGPLYQVKKMSDGETRDILVLRPGGLADSRSQDAFCEADPSCVIWRIYDQSPHGNHLDVGPGGGAVHAADKPVNASRAKISLGAHKVYGAFFEGGMGYSNSNTSGVAVGDEPESIYMVVSGSHFNGKCCMDYGNAEPDRNSHGPGTMEAIYFGSGQGHLAHPGEGKAPWIMGDLEAGLWGSDVKASREEPIHHELVTAMLKGDRTGADGKGHWVIKGGDATAGRLKVYFDGARPNTTTATTMRWPNSTGDAPMKKQGAIILGTGGDNSNKDVGTFFEGCITSGFASDATDEAVQANIVAAGYAAPTASASAEAASLGVSVIGAAAEPASAQHAASVVEADADALHMLPADHDVVIDPAGISISGLSSGADFTVQFQVAYSSLLAGSGVFAGQPYHCAVTRFQGDPLVNGSDPVCDDCPAGKTLEFDHCKHAATVDLVDPTVLADYARRQSAAGTIDDVAHLRHARIFLYRGTEDTCYQRGSVDKVRQFFAAFVANASAQLHFNRTTPSAHSWPTLAYGEPCGHGVIEACGYDGPGAALQHIYANSLKSPAPAFDPASLFAFDQRPFFGENNSRTGLNASGAVYVPGACRGARAAPGGCKLHVSLHGCGVNGYYDAQVAHLGFENWAEANAMVILFPRIAQHGTTAQSRSGCWDGYGQTGADYALRSGAQMAALRAMIRSLAHV